MLSTSDYLALGDSHPDRFASNSASRHQSALRTGRHPPRSLALKTILLTEYSVRCIILPWHSGVEFTTEFEAWWNGLDEEEQDSIDYSVRLLEERGPALRRPHVGTLTGSQFPNMKELRVQHHGRPYRYPLRLRSPPGGPVASRRRQDGENPSWTAEAIARADALYAAHLSELQE